MLCCGVDLFTTNIGYQDNNISLNNNLYENQNKQAIQIFHEYFSVRINGGKISSLLGDGVYVGMRSEWIGSLQINNLDIEVNNSNNAILFDLLPGHQLNLKTSNPNIISGKISGYIDESRNIGDKAVGNLKYSQNKLITINTIPTSIAKVNLETGFYKIVGEYTYTGSQIDMPLQLNSLTNIQLFNGTSFEKPYLVEQPGIIDFTASVPPNGTTGAISSFAVYRIC